MKHTIHLDFGKPRLGIDDAIRELQQYEAWLDKKMDELCRRLAEFGREQAQARFGIAVYEGDNSVTVTTKKTDNGYSIVANGEDVAFIEFGAGETAKVETLTTDTGDTIQNAPGVWSQDHAHQFQVYGSWFYDGRQYHRIVPNNCMYFTSRAIQSRLSDIAREVFSSD